MVRSPSSSACQRPRSLAVPSWSSTTPYPRTWPPPAGCSAVMGSRSLLVGRLRQVVPGGVEGRAPDAAGAGRDQAGEQRAELPNLGQQARDVLPGLPLPRGERGVPLGLVAGADRRGRLLAHPAPPVRFGPCWPKRTAARSLRPARPEDRVASRALGRTS